MLVALFLDSASSVGWMVDWSAVHSESKLEFLSV